MDFGIKIYDSTRERNLTKGFTRIREAIEKAAFEGKYSIQLSELSIEESNKLRNLGYKISSVQSGLNEYETIISWENINNN